VAAVNRDFQASTREVLYHFETLCLIEQWQRRYAHGRALTMILIPRDR